MQFVILEMYTSGFAFVLRVIAILGVLFELFLHKTDENKKGIKRTLFRVLLSSVIYFVCFLSGVLFPVNYLLLFIADISVFTGLGLLWTIFLLICLLFKEVVIRVKEAIKKVRKGNSA